MTAQVTLTNGLTVLVHQKVIADEMSTFVRISQQLIVGILKEGIHSSSHSGLYVFQENEGVYHYLGDILFRENLNKTVLWKVCVACLETPEFHEKARRELAESCLECPTTPFIPNKVGLLSGVR